MRKFLATSLIVLAAAIVSPSVASAATGSATTKFCDANFNISLLFNQLTGDETPKQLKAFAKKLSPHLTEAQKSAASEIKADVTSVVKALKTDPSALFTDDSVGEAGAAIDVWALENCDYEVVDVTAADYSFTGMPTTLPKGKVVVQMENTGAEPHVMVVVRKKTDATTEELLALPENQALKQLEEIGSVFAPAGESGTGYLELKKAGDYIALCPIPQGSHGDTQGSGPPHFVEGMVTDFTVENA